MIRDAKGVLATAEVKAAQSVVIGTDREGNPVQVQYPTHLVLKWETPRFEMDLTLDKAKVNPTSDPDEAFFVGRNPV